MGKMQAAGTTVTDRAHRARTPRIAVVAAGALAALALSYVPASAEPPQPEVVTAQRSGNTAYAVATFRWSTGGGVYDIDLSVYDWHCDSHPTYAYFEAFRPGTQTTTKTVNRVDYSGCDTGDWTSWKDLHINDSGDKITKLRLVVCIDTNNNVDNGGTGGRTGDDCTAGSWNNR